MIKPAMLALELAERTTRSGLTYREYTIAEHAVILSTYVAPEHAVAALLLDAYTLKVVQGEFPVELVNAVQVAKDRLKVDESGIAFLPPLHAAHIYMQRFLELGFR